MKLRATLSTVYEITEQQAHDSYGTTDPAECAKIDQESMDDDPGNFLMLEGKSECKVEVVE